MKRLISNDTTRYEAKKEVLKDFRETSNRAVFMLHRQLRYKKYNKYESDSGDEEEEQVQKPQKPEGTKNSAPDTAAAGGGAGEGKGEAPFDRRFSKEHKEYSGQASAKESLY